MSDKKPAAYKDDAIYTHGKSSPKDGSKRGCLCKDGTYHVDCCGGDAHMAQGIGAG